MKHKVMYDNTEIELTHREFNLLQILMENKNIVLNRDVLIEKVCGYDYIGETNVIDVYIRYLRTKIDDVFKVKIITTVRGVGYVIKDE
jgi:DNA-binding response OmpR family regulator